MGRQTLTFTKENNMSENFYFDIKGRSAMPFQVYIGGRGIGKSYSALRELATNFPADEKLVQLSLEILLRPSTKISGL